MTLARRHDGLKDQLVNSDGRVVATLDASKLGVSRRLAAALLRAHAAEYGHTAVVSQRQAFNQLRKLAACLKDLGLLETLPLPASCPMQIHDWLVAKGYVGSTGGVIQGTLVILLRWCHRNVPHIVSAKTSFKVPPFSRSAPKPRRKMTEAQTRAVLAACYSEIEAGTAKLSRGRHILQQTTTTTSDMELSRLVLRMRKAAGKKIPSLENLGRGKAGLMPVVRAHGGLTHIRSLLYPTHADVFPYYLAVLIQSGGNPSPVRLASRIGVVRPHPLRSDLETLEWEKPRARRQQRVDFVAGKQWSAPNLIRRLLEANECGRTLCAPSVRDKVFLAVSAKSGAAMVGCPMLMGRLLVKFIKRHNLPTFHFRDFRPTVARAHHVAAGSIQEARKRLNHVSESTTMRYSGPEDVATTNDLAIKRFQGELVHRAMGSEQSPANRARANTLGPAETVFGFQCKNPTAGFDGETPSGTSCLSFTRCCGCKGALVTLDDPLVVARLIGARDALRSAKERALLEGWWPRFKLLYDDTLTVITSELLPSVADVILKQAARRLRPHHIPRIE